MDVNRLELVQLFVFNKGRDCRNFPKYCRNFPRYCCISRCTPRPDLIDIGVMTRASPDAAGHMDSRNDGKQLTMTTNCYYNNNTGRHDRGV